jgi:hypothetical protein
MYFYERGEDTCDLFSPVVSRYSLYHFSPHRGYHLVTGGLRALAGISADIPHTWVAYELITSVFRQTLAKVVTAFVRCCLETFARVAKFLELSNS